MILAVEEKGRADVVDGGLAVFLVDVSNFLSAGVGGSGKWGCRVIGVMMFRGPFRRSTHAITKRIKEKKTSEKIHLTCSRQGGACSATGFGVVLRQVTE